MSSIISIFSLNCYIKSETVSKQYFSGLQPSLTRITRYVLCVRVSPLGFVLTPTKVPHRNLSSSGDIYEIKSIYNYFIIQCYPPGLLFGRSSKPLTHIRKTTTHRSGNKKSPSLCFLFEFFKLCIYNFHAYIIDITIPQNSISQSILMF